MSITYVSIDSKDRNKESKYIYNNKISNIYNKASIEQNSNELKLNSHNHELNNGNKVSLEVVEASSYTLQNPFIYKNYNGTIFVYVYQPNVIDTVPLFDPNRNSILNIVIEDFEYPSGTATFNVLTNNGTLELELSSLTHNLGSSENLTDLLQLNDKIQLDIDSDFISNNQIYTVYHLDTTTKIARVRCTHPKVEKFNSTTCQWSFVNTLNNQNTIADIHSYFHLIQPPRLLYLEFSEFDALGLSDGWFLDWYKFELPSFISHSVSANTLIKNIKFGGNVKIKLDTGIVHLSNNPLIITKNSNEITLMESLNSTIHSDEVELHNIQPVSNVISSMEAVETKTYLKFTHDDLNKNFPVNLDILVNNYITFDFSESLTSVIAFKDGGLINNDNTNSFRVLKVNVFKQITLDLLYEIDTDLSYITNGLKWTAVINNTPYKGYVKTPIEYLPKEINQIKVGLGDSNIFRDIKLKHSIFFDSGISNYDLTGNSNPIIQNTGTVSEDGLVMTGESSNKGFFTMDVDYSGAHTIAYWMKLSDNNPAYGGILDSANSGTRILLDGSGNTIYTQTYTGGSKILGYYTYPIDEWFFLVFVVENNTSAKMYAHSESKPYFVTQNTGTGWSMDFNGTHEIGRWDYNSRCLIGNIKSVNIWERALSSNEIKFIYNKGRNYNVYSNINYEKTYIDNVFMKITLGNTTNKSGFKINTTGVNVGDNVEITTDTTDYIEFGDGSRIDNLNLADSIIQEKLWTKYTIKGTGTRTFVFNQSITFTNKANNSVNGIIYSNIPVDINNTYRVTVTGSSTVPANIWTGGIQSTTLTTSSSTISSEFIVTEETLEIGVVFNTGTAVDNTFNITSVLLQQKVNQQFEVVAKSGNDLTLNAQKVITDIDSSNASFKVNGNIATIDKTPIDITKTGNNKNPNVSINDINIKINRSSSIITYLDDEVESRSVVNGTIFDYKDTYVLIKLEKDIKSITLSGTPTFEFVGPDRVLYTGEINTANIVSEANSYFFRNMIDTSDKLKFNNVGINFKTEALNSNTAFDIVDFDYAKDEATINLNREIKNIDVINDNLEDINIVHLNNISSTEQANWSLFMNDFNTNYKVIGSNATSLRLQGNVINKHNVYRFGGRFGWLKWKDNIGGIHNDFLNADLPQLNKKQAYHQVTNVNGHDFSIILSDNAKVGVVNGGHHIRIKQIMDNLIGYPNPNSYRIYLKNPLTNVISVNMESTEFTNTSFIITDSNNKIYWQNELDGDYIYNVTLDNGYYYFDTLATEIQNKMGKVNRIYDAEGVTHKILANVNTDTQEFTLQSYNETILYNPVSTSENSRVITISHNNHGFSTGDTITIFDSISVGRIPSTQINSEHEIIVLNDNAYTINVTTPSDSALLDQGGTIFAVLSYNKIRLRLDYENTIGNILGFDNTDIQDFSIKVSNKDYNKGLKHMNLFGNRYILMKCKTDKDFGVLQTNSLRDIFAKIQLSEIINNNVFNSFISRLKVFTDPITIEFIDIELYDENGKLFDFSDLDHSFTISVEQKIQ